MPALASSLLPLKPNTARVRVGVRAAVCAALPVALGAATGHTVTGLIASTGSLAALYSADAAPRREAFTVGSAAAVLVLSLACGTLAAHHPWPAVAVTALWTALVSYACTALAARPPGMMMFVLVCALGTVLPGNVLLLAAATAATGAAATLLSVLDQAWRTRRGQPEPVHNNRAARARTAARLAVAFNPAGSPFVLMALRSAGAVATAGAVSILLGLERPYWAMATAAAVLSRGNQTSTAANRALQRLLGTLAGCLLAALLLMAHPRAWAAALVLAALTFATELFVSRNYALAMVFVTPMALLLVDAAGPAQPVGALLTSRAVETFLGCAAALAASYAVTWQWARRHQNQALVLVLHTSADILAADETAGSQRRLGRLAAAVHRLQLVSERTRAERAAVSAATAPLQKETLQALDRAARLLQHSAPEPDPHTARALRATARQLETQPLVRGAA
ncbi:FUSC family protein [Streptomyces rishiriensis]|uniref:Membrane protein YccC n=1 Tax=Streptomyces rishiriensis TaxID=68264 RepID=A0ABU0NHH4_STRRH|nr:FUSC family protein [Streptomyces rishiriensis]MDQ0578082.1 putative membrane protein YccC [Streptomyces rishiriensis]